MLGRPLAKRLARRLRLFLDIVSGMDYSAWSEKHLEKKLIKDGTYATSVWCTKSSDKKLIVIVHGISGDYAGVVPLAVELSHTYRVAIVELPGHGDSDVIPLPNAAALQRWFDKTFLSIERELGDVAAVCAHSFGCSAVLSDTILAHQKVILLNPVPTPSKTYVTYARMIMDSAHFWAYIYNWRLFVLLRGMTLSKLHTHDAVRRVRWVGWHSHPNYDQIVFQAGLVDMILDGYAYRHVSTGKVALVVCATSDTTARQRDSIDMRAVFGDSKIVFLNGGHLLPIESPERVAHLITDSMVH